MSPRYDGKNDGITTRRFKQHPNSHISLPDGSHPKGDRSGCRARRGFRVLEALRRTVQRNKAFGSGHSVCGSSVTSEEKVRERKKGEH